MDIAKEPLKGILEISASLLSYKSRMYIYNFYITIQLQFLWEPLSVNEAKSIQT